MRRRSVSSDVALRSANAYRKNVFKFEGKERRGGRGESGRILITSSISQTEVAKKKKTQSVNFEPVFLKASYESFILTVLQSI